MDVIPFYEPGKQTGHNATGGTLTGGRFVGIAGDRVDDLPNIAYATAGAANPFGVLGQDCPDGDARVVYTEPGYIVPVEAGDAITAGAEVEVGADGVAIPADTGEPVGRCIDGTAAGDPAPIFLY